jgi:Cu/Ag efflux pump CusA
MSIVILGGLVTGTLGDLLILPILTFVFWRPGYARWSRRGPPTLSTAP